MSRTIERLTGKEDHVFDFIIRTFRGQIDSSEPKRRDQLVDSAYQITRFRDQLLVDPDKLAQLIETIGLLRASSGPGTVITEKYLIRELSCLMYDCVSRLLQKPADADAEAFNEEESVPDHEVVYRAVLEHLVAFARDSLSFKRPRDSFGRQRRAEAFSLLTQACKVLDFPDIFDLSQQMLTDKKSGREVGSALEFLEVYFSYIDEPISDELEALLKEFVSRTGYRSSAAGALKILVITNCISELGALNRIDDWKEAHQYF